MRNDTKKVDPGEPVDLCLETRVFDSRLSLTTKTRLMKSMWICFVSKTQPYVVLFVRGLENGGIQRRGKHVFVTAAAEKSPSVQGDVVVLGLEWGFF